MDFLLSLDVNLFTAINSTFSHPWLDTLFPLLTDLHKQAYFAVLPAFIALVLWRVYRGRGMLIFFALLITVGFTDFSSTRLLKKPIDRQRPFATQGVVAIQRSPAAPGKSFPSNHSANMFALATFMAVFVPAMGPGLFFLALLTAYGRVYCGVHFPSDVIAGAVWGMLIAGGLARLLRRPLIGRRGRAA